MKKAGRISIWFLAGLLCLCGMAGRLTPEVQAVQKPLQETVMNTVQASFTALYPKSTLYEVPPGTFAPTVTHTQGQGRPMSALQLPGCTPAPTIQFNRVSLQGSGPRPFPIAVRAVSHYVYGMRKILI